MRYVFENVVLVVVLALCLFLLISLVVIAYSACCSPKLADQKVFDHYELENVNRPIIVGKVIIARHVPAYVVYWKDGSSVTVEVDNKSTVESMVQGKTYNIYNKGILFSHIGAAQQ